MSIESESDLLGLMRIGRIVGLTLQHMRERVRAGMTTAELDAIGAEFLQQNGARSAPIITYNFPGFTCISINDEAAHGIPGERVIQEGDLVNIDVSAELDGFYADTGATVPIPPVAPLQEKLCSFGQSALKQGINAAQAGRPIYEIGRAIESEARRGGFTTIRDLPGHGVGRHLHEPPSVPAFYTRQASERLTDGLVITIEPFVSTGARRIVQMDDGWTLKTPDGSLIAQYEHTVVITRGRPILVTTV